MRRVYITGASGAGVSTLGKALAATLHVPQADIDDYYWLPTEIPFSKRRRVTDRVRLLKSALGAKGWVLSGSFDSWADTLLDWLDLVVFVSAPTSIQLARLLASDNARFVALVLLRNAEIAAEMEFTSCQDTGTAHIPMSTPV